MVVAGIVVLWLGLGWAVFVTWRIASQRQRTEQRFTLGAGSWSTIGQATLSPVDVSPRTGSVDDAASPTAAQVVRGTRRLTRKWIWVPWATGGLVVVLCWFGFGWPIQYALAVGAIGGLMAAHVEGMLHTWHVATLERQLADAIDIMIGAISAGAALGPAIEAATIETARPLKPYLEEIAGRIRLGDEPIAVFRSLADRVPLETFLLFTTSLAVHYEVGGRLAPTLATVGATIRDRIEVSRRIQSNIAQSQFSTFAILGLTYLIALIVWRNGPDAMREFVTSSIGSWFVAGSIILQAVGIVWMNLISKPRF